MTEYSVDGMALDRDRMMILSLRPRFADAILSGVKTVELRRTEPKIRVPTLALIYASTPVRALLGTCVVTSVESGHLAALWRVHGAGSGLDHGEFLNYFEGVEAGTALTPGEAQGDSASRFLSQSCVRGRRGSVHRRASPTSTWRPAIASCRWPRSQRTGPATSPAVQWQSHRTIMFGLPVRGSLGLQGPSPWFLRAPGTRPVRPAMVLVVFGGLAVRFPDRLTDS